ncbi:MAG: TonB-dependent receptor [Gammaproteobacteria bacterium]
MAGINAAAMLAGGVAAVAPGIVAAAGIEEVVVTAQRREESLQDVPLAITALGTESLEKMNLHSMADFAKGAVPALNAQPFSARPDDLQITIRGVGEADPVQTTLDRAVAIYVDNVYLARAPGSGAELADIERVEVLRGPQGTLFGRNAMGGAINITSQKPLGKLRIRESFDYGTYDKIRSKTTIDLPEMYGVSLRFDYVHDQVDGWTKFSAGALAKMQAANINPEFFQEDMFGRHDKDGFRIAARWRPTDDITVDYAYDQMETEYVQAANTLFGCVARFPTSLLAAQRPAFSGCQHPQFTINGVDISFGVPAGGYRERLKTLDYPLPIHPNETSTKGHSVTAQWNINDQVTLKSITAYRAMTDEAYSPIGPTVAIPLIFGPIGAFSIGDAQNFTGQKQHQFQQEIQLLGDTERFDYTVGFMYFNEHAYGYTHQPYGLINLGTVPQAVAAGIFGLPAGLATFGTGVIPYTPQIQALLLQGYTPLIGAATANALFGPNGSFHAVGNTAPLTTSTVDTDSIGIYGQGTWTPPVWDDRMHVTFGLRYSQDAKDLLKILEGNRLVNVLATQPVHRIDPAATVAFDWTQDLSTYVRYAQGYRNGGASIRESIARVTDPTSPNFGQPLLVLGVPDTGFHVFNPEVVRSWEIGMKSDWFDKRLRFNADIYHQTYEGAQTSFQKLGQISNTYFANYPQDITILGAEIDATMVPMDGLTINVAYTWSDCKVPASGDPLVPNIPNCFQTATHRWFAGIDYDFPQFGFGMLSAHMDMSGSTKYSFSTSSAGFQPITGFPTAGGFDGFYDNFLLNARLTLSELTPFGADRGNVKIAVYGANLTDNAWHQYGFSVPQTNVTIGNIVYGTPRTFGVNLVYEYQ